MPAGSEKLKIASRVFEAVSVRQARVALSHFMSDADLVVQTMESFAPDGLKKEAAQA